VFENFIDVVGNLSKNASARRNSNTIQVIDLLEALQFVGLPMIPRSSLLDDAYLSSEEEDDEDQTEDNKKEEKKQEEEAIASPLQREWTWTVLIEKDFTSAEDDKDDTDFDPENLKDEDSLDSDDSDDDDLDSSMTDSFEEEAKLRFMIEPKLFTDVLQKSVLSPDEESDDEDVEEEEEEKEQKKESEKIEEKADSKKEDIKDETKEESKEESKEDEEEDEEEDENDEPEEEEVTSQFKISKQAADLLHSSAENYLAKLYTSALIASQYAKRSEISVEELEFILKLWSCGPHIDLANII